MRRAVAAVGLAAVLIGCRMPLFDPGLSLALSTARRMDHLVTVGPFTGWLDGDPNVTYTFIPDRADLVGGSPLGRGYVISRRPDRVAVRFSDGVSLWDPPWESWGGSDVLGALDLGWLVLFRLGDLLPQRADFLQFGVPAGVEADLGFYVDTVVSVSASVDYVAGVHAIPGISPGQTYVFLIGLDTTTGAYWEAFAFVDTTTFPPGSFGPAGALPSGMAIQGLPAVAPGRAAYYYRPDPVAGRSFLSVPGAGGFATYTWKPADTPPVTERLPLKLRVDAVLSAVGGKGRLAHFGYDLAYVYGLDGRLDFKFPTGSLEFAGEYVWPNGVLRCVFVLPLRSAGDGGDSLSFEVYAIDTEDLEDLSGLF